MNDADQQSAVRGSSGQTGDADMELASSSLPPIDDYIPDLGGDELQNVQDNSLPNNFQNYRQTSPPVNQGVIPSMLRMVGLDEQKLGMMALNMLVGESI